MDRALFMDFPRPDQSAVLAVRASTKNTRPKKVRHTNGKGNETKTAREVRRRSFTNESNVTSLSRFIRHQNPFPLLRLSSRLFAV